VGSGEGWRARRERVFGGADSGVGRISVGWVCRAAGRERVSEEQEAVERIGARWEQWGVESERRHGVWREGLRS